MFGGMGFNQVIESYLNFGIPGIVLFFGLMGYGIGYAENRIRTRVGMAYLGTITCVLINATRNYFAFVPGHLLIVTAVFIFVKYAKVGGKLEVQHTHSRI